MVVAPISYRPHDLRAPNADVLQHVIVHRFKLAGRTPQPSSFGH